MKRDMSKIPIIIFLITFICLALLSPDGHSAQVTLRWEANTDPSIAGYKIYYGGSSGSYQVVTDAGMNTVYTISNLESGSTYYFAATAYNTSGIESGYSNEVSYTTPTQSGSGDWVFCGIENQLCSFTGTQNVRYGANGVYVFKTLTDGTMCNNGVFGDPLPGAAKECYVEEFRTFTITTSAGSGGTISPSGSVQIAAGESQTFTITPSNGYQVNSILVDGTHMGTLSTYTFSNVRANHSISASFALSSSSGDWVFCANENELCSFTGTQNVRYGVDGVYVFKTLTDGTRCSNSVFGDPLPGEAKQCHTK
jgi:hypothetical protein